MNKAKVFPYSDVVSTLVLWQKAIFLIPIWAFPLIPIAGAVVSLGGDLVNQVGYTLLMGAFFGRFVEDVLKTKISIESGRIFFGYRVFELNKLASVGLEYKSKKMLPRAIVLNFSDGKKLKLKIERLQAEHTEQILKLIELQYPTAKIDPVLRTLSKCKRLAKNTALETQDKVEIPYHSRKIFGQLKDTFLNTADAWMRSGPLVCFMLCTMVWLSCFSVLFVSLSLVGMQDMDHFAIPNAIKHIGEKVNGSAAEAASFFAKNMTEILTNPLVAIAMLATLVAIIFYLMRYLLRPNVLLLDQNRVNLQLRFGNTTFNVGSADWSSLSHAYLEAPKASADPEKCKVIFKQLDGNTSFKLNLAGIAESNRTRLLKAMERLAPHCKVEPQLAEALMPKQERSYTELWLQSLSAPPERKSLEPLAPGQVLREGRFEVWKRLGIGGQGSAYLCKDLSELQEHAQAEVVLKETILPVFVEQTVRQQALERFQQEAQMLNKLNSDRIVKLLDYFIEDHRAYLVLEHIEGRTLRQVVDEDGPLSVDKATDLAVQMCKILSYLHEQGIIHRDFTPDNLILGVSGKLKLIDFNVAQSAESGTTGTIVGKHAYLPPEQFRGKPTFQSDIYAMGACLHFLTTGKDPEPITQSNPTAVSPAVPQAFSDVVAACTNLQTNKRYQTAKDACEGFLTLYQGDDGETLGNPGEASGDVLWRSPPADAASEEGATISTTAAQDGHTITIKIKDGDKLATT